MSTDHNPLDVLLLLARHWRQLALITTASLLLGLLTTAWIIPTSYTAVAILLAPPPFQSVASLANADTNAAGAQMTAGEYVGILDGPTIEDRIIQDFHLQSLWKLKTLSDTRTRLESEIQIGVTDYGMIVITVRDHDPARAAALANAYIQELNRFDTTLAGNEAAHRGEIFAQQVSLAKQTLLADQDQFKQTQQQTALLGPSSQASQAVQDIARLHAQIATRNAQLQGMHAYATDANPDVILLKARINALQHELDHLQHDPQQRLPGDVQIPAGNLPGLILRYQRALRNLTRQQAFYEALSTQLAAARIDQAQPAPVSRVIQLAVTADKKTGPERLLIWIAFLAIGFAAGCLRLFLKQALTLTRNDPIRARELNALRNALGLHTHA